MRLSLLVFSIFLSVSLSAQIWTQDFETNGLGATYTSASVFTDNLNGHYNRTNGSNISNTVAPYSNKHGNLAAGTSTGGLTNKRYGRIGDSPLIGSGTYADNSTCAVSCTGKGEDFIRLNVAHDIASMMRYARLDVKAACDSVVMNKLKDMKGRGGCIAIDGAGNIAMPFTTTGMFRGSIDVNGKKQIALYEGN